MRKTPIPERELDYPLANPKSRAFPARAPAPGAVRPSFCDFGRPSKALSHQRRGRRLWTNFCPSSGPDEAGRDKGKKQRGLKVVRLSGAEWYASAQHTGRKEGRKEGRQAGRQREGGDYGLAGPGFPER